MSYLTLSSVFNAVAPVTLLDFISHGRNLFVYIFTLRIQTGETSYGKLAVDSQGFTIELNEITQYSFFHYMEGKIGFINASIDISRLGCYFLFHKINSKTNSFEQSF